MDELGRRRQLGIGPQRPFAIVEIQVRHDVGQIDVGFPIGVHRSDVAPVGFLLVLGAHAGSSNNLRDRLAMPDEPRDDVPAEIAGDSGRPRRGAAGRTGNRRLEHIDPHGGQRAARPVGRPGGSVGFSRKSTIRLSSPTAIMPKPDASARATSMQPTVTSACESTWSRSIGS